LAIALLCAGAACDGGGAGTGADAATCATDELEWGHGGDLMLPGTDCMQCHRAGGRAADSVFTAAGTVFLARDCPDGLEGALVVVEDTQGRIVEMTTNEVGNFQTSEPLSAVVRTSVELDGVIYKMLSAPTTGACGSCHLPGSGPGLVWAAP
jgi:hypothetical protein